MNYYIIRIILKVNIWMKTADIIIAINIIHGLIINYYSKDIDY